MIIKQPAQKLPTVAVKTLLKLGVREPRGVGAVEKTHQRLELLTTGNKPGPSSTITRRATGGARSWRCSIATNPPVRQEFITRRVKFATTGVEIGGHVGHLRGRRCT